MNIHSQLTRLYLLFSILSIILTPAFVAFFILTNPTSFKHFDESDQKILALLAGWFAVFFSDLVKSLMWSEK